MNDPEQLNWVSSLITIATNGGFAALVWYLVVKHIPMIEERHKKERDEWRDTISKMFSDSAELNKKMLVAIERLKTLNEE